MSLQLIQQYHAKVEKIIRYSGSRNESALRKPFQDLLEAYALSKNLLLVTEVELRTRGGRRVVPDGTLKDALRQDWGYWESKDEKDDLAAEIAAKFARGYPATNILFEDTRSAVLYQDGQEALRADFADAPALDALLTRFVRYEPPEVSEFHRAIEQFNADVPALAGELRAIIEEHYAASPAFRQALDEFLALCQRAINPRVEMADVREMIIQHVLTEDIFMTVFDEPQFHRENAIARKLQEVVDSFYHGAARRTVHARIAPYYETINARAAQIYNHWEKQKFLKALYENFYRAYNPKAADRLGIVYTPDEIVRFMIHAADHLAFKHFGRTLGDAGVEILDPATGTGTFITELIEYLPESQLKYKYQREIHCNEVAILPYYIANLNIEYTYRQKMREYLPFENICFVDTLDNMGFVKSGQHQMDFFAIVDENIERIQRQNQRRISVILGNPPYNAWQENFNLRNPNRPYQDVDRRIRETYIKHGTAQNQIAVYDMYTRFLRWASDRLDKNGIIAFVSNNSFLDARTYDGFRKVVAEEFSHIYVIDLKGNARTSGERRRREGGNVFSDQIRVGVAVYFLARKEGEKGCRIWYNAVDDSARAEEKKAYLRDNGFADLQFQSIHPDKNYYWINQAENDFDELLPLMDKSVKSGTGQGAVFTLYSRGNASQRDEWVYDFSRPALEDKMRYFIRIYESTLQDRDFPDRLKIKWDRELTKYLVQGIAKEFDQTGITSSLYRPFTTMHLYFDRHFNGMTYQLPNIFPHPDSDNLAICFTDAGSEKPFMSLVTDKLPDLHLVGAGSSTQCLPLYRFQPQSPSPSPPGREGVDSPPLAGEGQGVRVDNITDWALAQFQERYGPHPQPLSPWERGANFSLSLSQETVGREADSPFLQETGGHFTPLPVGGGAGVRETSGVKIKPPLPPALLQRARELRQDATDAERLLWQLLRDRQLAGHKFRRQHPLAGYILDFYCHEAKLAVELDGSQHAQPEQAEYDAERTRVLQAEGVRVLRFWNNDVLRNTEAVLEAILDALISLHPQPLSQGEREAEAPHPPPLSQGEKGAILPSPFGRGVGGEGEPHPITKLDIFHYVYAVLHHPAYRQKYALNLKREFPRIPFYEDFWQWAEWGRQLMELHLGYEQAEPYPLERVDRDPQGLPDLAGLARPRLMAHKETGVIEVDTLTTLRGVPYEAWEYRLGTYSALEWVLERYKERAPKDPTIRERFNTYRFADYKEHVIDLLRRVCTVSLNTMEIVRHMPG